VAQRPGTITEIDGLERALGEAGVVEAAFIRKPGDVLQIYNDFRDRIAYVIASGKTTSSAAENAAHALQRLQYSLE
jgi:biotin carboxylase